MDRDETLKEFGEKVRRARRNANISQSELADKCGVNRASIIRIEKGTVEARPALLDSLIKELKLEINGRNDLSKLKSSEEHKFMDVFQLGNDELMKSMLSFIPGGQVFDSVLNFRSNLKIRRTIEFSASVKSALEQILDRELHSEDFTRDDVSDVIDSIMSQVHKTKSGYKLERFRNILVRQFVEPARDYEVNSYIRLVEEMSDVELIMLDLVSTCDPKVQSGHFPRVLAWYNRKSPIVDEGQQYKIHLRIGNEDFEITDAQIDYFENNLVSKGLIQKTISNDTGSRDIDHFTLEDVSDEIERFRQDNFEVKYLTTTLFGDAFLAYIKEPS